MGLFLESLMVAGKCQAQVALLTGTGAAAACLNILDRATVKSLSRFHLTFLNKCIILQLNQYYSLERLIRWAPVILVALLHIFLGAALGALGGRFVKSPRKELLVLMTAFGNCGALPFVLILPVVRNWKSTRDDPFALQTGFGVIGLYLGTWFCVFFSFGKAYAARIGSTPPLLNKHDHASESMASHELESASEVSHSSASGVALREASSCSSDAKPNPNGLPPPTSPPPPRTACRRPGQALYAALTKIDPVIYCVLSATGIGCWSSLRSALGPEGGLNWLGDSWSAMGQAGVVVGTFILGAGLWGAYIDARRRDSRSSLLTQILADPDAATFIGLACLLRLLVLPALCLPLHVLAIRSGLLPADPTLQMVITLCAGVPSSQTLVMLLTATGAATTAGEASTVYVPVCRPAGGGALMRCGAKL